jgi:hypothetical protein
MTRSLCGLLTTGSAAAHADELGPKRIKCLYGYVTAKTGNFDAARQIDGYLKQMDQQSDPASR